MFPAKGTTVWVNFRDRPYLGKVLQTSPELDMVCVRISDYLDHVSRDMEGSAIFSHSCPESNTSILSARQSSVVITCGLNDIYSLDSPISHDFTRMHIDHDQGNMENNSRSENDLKSLDIDFNTDEEKSTPFQSNNNLPEDIENGEEDDDEDFSNSFEIDNILRETHHSKRNISSDYKMWKCRFCHLYFGDENDVCHHIIAEHRLDSHIESDNWIVIGGVNDLDYEKVKFEEDNNIKSLNGIHLSNNSNRKRQFIEYKAPSETNYSEMNVRKDSLLDDSFDTSMRSDLENGSNELRSDEITFPILDQIIQKTRSLATEIDRLSSASLYRHSSTQSNEFTSLNNECIELKLHNDMLHHFLLNSNFPSTIPFSLTNSLPTPSWSERFRSSSLTANYSQDQVINLDTMVDHQPMFSSPKRTRIEGNIKKCRKMYGIDQRHLWCNQCKWKKACSRFSNEINTSI